MHPWKKTVRPRRGPSIPAEDRVRDFGDDQGFLRGLCIAICGV